MDPSPAGSAPLALVESSSWPGTPPAGRQGVSEGVDALAHRLDQETPSAAAGLLEPIAALPAVMDLAAIGQPAEAPKVRTRTWMSATVPRPAAPATQTPSPARRRRLGLSTAELAGIAHGDPLLEAELALRTTPRPIEPPPETLSTAELLGRLPGRHDLLGPASQRLCAELGDCKPATWSFCLKAAEAVATRSVPCGVLLDCLRQATGPQARDRGRVFVVAWKREGRPPD